MVNETPLLNGVPEDKNNIGSTPIIPAQQGFSLKGILQAIQDDPSLIDEYIPDIKEELAGLGSIERGLAEMFIRSKAPAVWERIQSYQGNGERDTARDYQDKDEEDEPETPVSPEPEMDAEMLNEVADYACKLYMGGFNFSQISDSLYAKYEVDWHPLRVQSVVLKRLAWQSRGKDEPKETPLKLPEKPVEQKVGLIRTIWRKLY